MRLAIYLLACYLIGFGSCIATDLVLKSTPFFIRGIVASSLTIVLVTALHVLYVQ